MTTDKINFEETIISGDHARTAMLNGVKKVAAAVTSTLGPDGKIVILGATAQLRATKDGVSVAREITLPDRWENMAAKLMIDVAKRSESVAGDGTTTSTLLAEKLCVTGVELIEKGSRPNQVVRKLTNMVNAAKGKLLEQRVTATTLDELTAVAKVSSNAEATGDLALAEMAAKAVHLTGAYGQVLLKKGYDTQDHLIHTSGYSMQRGIHAVQRNLCASSPIKEDSAYIIVTQDEIDTVGKMVTIMKSFSQRTQGMQPRPLILMVSDASDTAVAALNQMANQFKQPTFVVRAPGAASQQAALLEDIGVLAGSTPIPIGRITSDAEIDEFANYIGVIKSFTLATNSFIFQHDTDVSKHIKDLEDQIPQQDDGYSRDLLKERIARISGGIATILVGGHTEAEVSERQDRFDDSVKAVRVALLEGVVRGGGYALLEAFRQLSLEKSIPMGDYYIYRKILLAPINKILSNAYYSEDEINDIINVALNATDDHCYQNIILDRMVTADQYTVVDPYVVTTTALDNALSVAKLVILADVMIGPSTNRIQAYGL